VQKIYCDKCGKDVTEKYYIFDTISRNEIIHNGNQNYEERTSYRAHFCKEHYHDIMADFYDFLKEHRIEV